MMMMIGLPLRIATQLVVTEGRDRGHNAARETGYENQAAWEMAGEQDVALREEAVVLKREG